MKQALDVTVIMSEMVWYGVSVSAKFTVRDIIAKLSQSRNLPPHLSTNTHARLDIDALVAQLNMDVKACAKTYLAWLMQGTPVRCKKHLQRAMANMLSTILKPKTQCQAAIWPEMGKTLRVWFLLFSELSLRTWIYLCCTYGMSLTTHSTSW